MADPKLLEGLPAPSAFVCPRKALRGGIQKPTKWLHQRQDGSKNDVEMPPRRASRVLPCGCASIERCLLFTYLRPHNLSARQRPDPKTETRRYLSSGRKSFLADPKLLEGLEDLLAKKEAAMLGVRAQVRPLAPGLY